MKKLIFFFFLLLFIKGVSGCDWQVSAIEDNLFVAFNHRTFVYELFNTDDLPEKLRDKVFEGAFFNVFTDRHGSFTRIEFCEAEIA